MNKSILHQLSRNLCLVALSFLLLLGSLMVIESHRAGRTLPGTEQILQDLRRQIGEKQDDQQLKNLIRDLDLLYRQAYFLHQDRMNLGRQLLVAGLAAFLLGAILLTLSGAPQLAPPAAFPAAAHLRQQRYLRHVLAALLVVIFSGLILSMLRELLLPRPTAVASAALPADANSAASAISPDSSMPRLGLSESLARGALFWPGFRGSLLPNHNRLPASWDLRPAWKVKLPLPGFNSPVIWEEQIYLTGANQEQRSIFCHSLTDGKLLWSFSADKVDKLPTVTDDTGYAAPTAVVDDHGIIAVFATGQILALDHQGQKRWQHKLPDLKISYGYASSPLLAGDLLIIQHDTEQRQTVLALDAITGKTAWNNTRASATSWSSPTLLLPEQGNPVIFTAGNAKVEAFDLLSGKLLWENNCLDGEVATTGHAIAGKVFFANAGALTAAFNAHQATPEWENANIPMPDVASPIVAGGAMYLFTSGGSVIVLNADNGEELYEENFDNGFYASPVLLDGKIIAVNLDGKLLVIKPSVERFQLIAEFDLGEPVVAVPAFAHGRIIIRTMHDHLLCLEAAP